MKDGASARQTLKRQRAKKQLKATTTFQPELLRRRRGQHEEGKPIMLYIENRSKSLFSLLLIALINDDPFLSLSSSLTATRREKQRCQGQGRRRREQEENNNVGAINRIPTTIVLPLYYLYVVTASFIYFRY